METGKEFWNDEYKSDPTQVMVRDYIVKKEIENIEVGKALDLGCGKGDNCVTLVKKGFTVKGIDWSSVAIDLGKKYANENNLDIEYQVGDITTWEPDQEYDLVISTYALPEDLNKNEVLKTGIKALKKGGTIIVVEWDKAMSKVWGIRESELSSPEEIVNGLGDVEIESAEVRHIQSVPTSPRDLRAGLWHVAFVRATKK